MKENNSTAPSASSEKESTRQRVYVYTDNFGDPVYRKVRPTGPKGFIWERLDDKGNWVQGLGGRARYLYRLPELIESPDRVWLAEGEKDADTLCALGLTATTCGGANEPWLSEYDRCVAGRDVVVLTDNDAPGWERGNMLAEKLCHIAKSLRIVSFTGTDLPEHGDVTDWLESGHPRKELEALADATPVVEKDESASPGTSDNDGPAHIAMIDDMPDSVLSGRLGELYQRTMRDFPIAYAWPALSLAREVS
jgi:DNA primase